MLTISFHCLYSFINSSDSDDTGAAVDSVNNRSELKPSIKPAPKYLNIKHLNIRQNNNPGTSRSDDNSPNNIPQSGTQNPHTDTSILDAFTIWLDLSYLPQSYEHNPENQASYDQSVNPSDVNSQDIAKNENGGNDCLDDIKDSSSTISNGGVPGRESCEKPSVGKNCSEMHGYMRLANDDDLKDESELDKRELEKCKLVESELDKRELFKRKLGKRKLNENKLDKRELDERKLDEKELDECEKPTVGKKSLEMHEYMSLAKDDDFKNESGSYKRMLDERKLDKRKLDERELDERELDECELDEHESDKRRLGIMMSDSIDEHDKCTNYDDLDDIKKRNSRPSLDKNKYYKKKEYKYESEKTEDF